MFAETGLNEMRLFRVSPKGLVKTFKLSGVRVSPTVAALARIQRNTAVSKNFPSFRFPARSLPCFGLFTLSLYGSTILRKPPDSLHLPHHVDGRSVSHNSAKIVASVGRGHIKTRKAF
jgi:hypothetical protein